MKRILTILMLMTGQYVYAQVLTQFLPEVHGRSVDALLQVKYLNASQTPVQGALTITVNEAGSGPVLQISLPSVTLQAGVNIIPRHLISDMNIRFYQNNLATLVSQTNRFPQGEYQYCFGFSSAHAVGGEECFDYIVEPVLPLLLSDPYDQSEICETRPGFHWQPMLPALPGTQYQLNLVELKEGQSPQEALVYNLPVIQQPGIFSPMLIYPSNAPSLEEKKTYVWQVSAVLNNVVLTRSEIWQFTVNCDIEAAPPPRTGFRNIDDLSKGNFYIAAPYLSFYIKYPYNTEKLSYEIIPVKKNGQRLKRLPVIKTTPGTNYISIDLDDIGGMKNGEYYLLVIKMPNGTKKQLRFLYHESNE